MDNARESQRARYSDRRDIERQELPNTAPAERLEHPEVNRSRPPNYSPDRHRGRHFNIEIREGITVREPNVDRTRSAHPSSSNNLADLRARSRWYQLHAARTGRSRIGQSPGQEGAESDNYKKLIDAEREKRQNQLVEAKKEWENEQIKWKRQDSLRIEQDTERRAADERRADEDEAWYLYISEAKELGDVQPPAVSVHLSDEYPSSRVRVRVSQSPESSRTAAEQVPAGRQRRRSESRHSTRYHRGTQHDAVEIRLADLSRRQDEDRRRAQEDLQRHQEDRDREVARASWKAAQNKSDECCLILLQYFESCNESQRQLLKQMGKQLQEEFGVFQEAQTQTNLMFMINNGEIYTEPIPKSIFSIRNYRDNPLILSVSSSDNPLSDFRPSEANDREDCIGFCFTTSKGVPIHGNVFTHRAPIGRPHHHDHYLISKMLKFYQQRVQGLFSFITRTELSGAKLKRIEGINKSVVKKRTLPRNGGSSGKQTEKTSSNELGEKPLPSTEMHAWERLYEPDSHYEWLCTAQVPLVEYKDQSSYARFRDHLRKEQHESSEWLIKIEKLMKQVPRENKCIIWVHLEEAPNFGFIKFLAFFIFFICSVAGVIYGLVTKDVDKGLNLAKNLAAIVAALSGVVAAGAYVDDEHPESVAYAFDTVFQCLVEGVGGD